MPSYKSWYPWIMLVFIVIFLKLFMFQRSETVSTRFSRSIQEYPSVYFLLKGFFEMLPGEIQPMILDPDLYKCVTKNDCKEMNKTQQIRLSLLPSDWKKLQHWLIENAEINDNRTLYINGHETFYINNRKMIYKINKTDIFISEMTPKSQYWFVAGDRQLKFDDLRFIDSPLSTTSVFGCCNATLFEDVDLFIRQVNSPFIPCQYDLALNFSKRDPNMYKSENRVVKSDFIDTLADIRDELYQLGVFPFLISGTLLGWYRECDFIPHTSDIDLAVFSSQLTPEIPYVLNSSLPCEFFDSLGFINSTHNDYYEFKLKCNGTFVDVFAMYSDGLESWIGTYGSIKEEKTLIEDLCVADLLGHLFFVPCQVEVVLEKEYGQTWREIL